MTERPAGRVLRGWEYAANALGDGPEHRGERRGRSAARRRAVGRAGRT